MTAAEVEVAPVIVDVQQRRGNALGRAPLGERRGEPGLAAAIDAIHGHDAATRARHAGDRQAWGGIRQAGVNSWTSAAPAREIATMRRISSTTQS